MAGKGKPLLIEYELEFLEKQLQELKDYIEANPYSTLTDRMNYKETRNGGMIQLCVANKEAQRKDLTQALKDYAEILRTVDQMRTRENEKTTPVRGDIELGSQASQFLKTREKNAQ